MMRAVRSFGLFAVLLALTSMVGPGNALPGAERFAQSQPITPDASVQPVAVIGRTGPPPVEDALNSGVLIVISKGSQRMHVFKDGMLWASAPVSTGKRGHGTPAGTFAILQKRVYHRSNLYSNAPMPYMQRLTWGGIAIHAGRVPGYPASHGCIRLPYSFARKLFALTRADATTVVIINDAAQSGDHAVQLALGTEADGTAFAAAPAYPSQPSPSVRPPTAATAQTIQLAAAISPGEAEAHWQNLIALYPELAGFSKAVIPAVVGSRQFYRLRATAPGAHNYCRALKQAGQDCFKVT